MKKFLFQFLIVILLSCGIHGSAGAQTRYVGGDISLLPEYETAGAFYADHDGNPVSSPLSFFKDQGMNAMRIRLFVNPDDYTGSDKDANACQDLDYVTNLGKRIKAAGFKLMLDFHYSDTWADPSKQWTPSAWSGLSDEELYKKIYDYTKTVLTQLKAAGAEPDFIQTGNEITYGMLWGSSADAESSLRKCYTNSTSNWSYFTSLLKNATKACREVCPDAKVIIHTERVSSDPTLQKDNTDYAILTGFYDRMASYGIDYDVIGLSYYPYFHGSIAQLDGAIDRIEGYGKPIMIVETGYPYAWKVSGTTYDYSSVFPYTEDGQKAFTDSLITMLQRHPEVTGLFWWWMEYNAKGTNLTGWYNAPLFDSRTGRATAALSELKNFLSTASGISSIKSANLINSTSKWYSTSGITLKKKPHQRGIYIYNGRKIAIGN